MLQLLRCAAGCDVLWGACPMVTLPLERMASRVAASLCYATGLGSEMVVSNQVLQAFAQALTVSSVPSRWSTPDGTDTVSSHAPEWESWDPGMCCSLARVQVQIWMCHALLRG